MENLRGTASGHLLVCLLGKPSPGCWPCGSHGLSPARLAPSTEVSDIPALAGALFACGSSLPLELGTHLYLWGKFTFLRTPVDFKERLDF